jgi:hypothetical protein
MHVPKVWTENTLPLVLNVVFCHAPLACLVSLEQSKSIRSLACRACTVLLVCRSWGG